MGAPQVATRGAARVRGVRGGYIEARDRVDRLAERPLIRAVASPDWLEPGTYQALKMRVLETVPLAKDAVHIYVGVAALLVSVFLLRRSIRSPSALVLGFLLSLAMEALDVRDSLAARSGVSWLPTVKDLLNTNAIPVLIVLLARWQARRGP